MNKNNILHATLKFEVVKITDKDDRSIDVVNGVDIAKGWVALWFGYDENRGRLIIDEEYKYYRKIFFYLLDFQKKG